MATRQVLYWSLGIVGVAGTAWAVTRFDLTQIDPTSVAAQIRAAGPLGPIALLALFVLQCVVAPLPSEPLMMAAGYVYGAPAGFLIAWLGVVAGATLSFALARRFGRPFAERFVAARKLAVLDAFGDGSARALTFAAVLALRLVAFTAFDVISYACGIIRFPFRLFLLATIIGSVPKVLAFTYAGANVAQRPAWLDWVMLAGTFGVLLATPWLVQAWRRRRIAEGRGEIG